MIKSRPSDQIADFIDFYETICGKAAIDERIGSSDEEINKFVGVCGHVLPPLYIAYLREFGKHDGILRLGDNGEFQLNRLIQFYEKQLEKKRQWVPKNTVLFSLEGLSGGRGFYYGNQDFLKEPNVVTTWNNEVGATRAASFRNYLYHQAFLRGRFPRGTIAVALHSNSKELTSRLTDYAGNFGFMPYWFCDEYQACMEGDGQLLLINQAEDGTDLFVNSPFSQAKEEQTKKVFMDQFNLSDATPYELREKRR